MVDSRAFVYMPSISSVGRHILGTPCSSYPAPRWLLGRDPVPSGEDAEELVQVNKGVPIYVSSLTARADGDKLVFANDVYGLDKPGAEDVTKVAAADGDSRAQ